MNNYHYYEERLAALDAKLEREGLTDNDKAEMALIQAKMLLELRETNKALLKQLQEVAKA